MYWKELINNLNMKYINKIVCIITILALNFTLIMAQPGDPGGGPGGGSGSVGGDVPLNGGTFYLLIAGIVLVGYKNVKTWFNKTDK